MRSTTVPPDLGVEILIIGHVIGGCVGRLGLARLLILARLPRLVGLRLVGAGIVLAALGDTDRTVWACDSFEGLPEADAERFPLDVPLRLHEHSQLAIGLDQVRANFARYGLLDDQVRFVPGWFRDTLPKLAADGRSPRSAGRSTSRMRRRAREAS